MDRRIVCHVVALAALGMGCGASSTEAPAAPVAAAGSSAAPAAGSGTHASAPAAAGGGAQPSTPAAGSGARPGTTAAGAPATAGSAGAATPPSSGMAGAAAPVAGSAGSAGQAAPSGDEKLPCDVADVISRQCLSCHGSPTNLGAPMMLVTFADFHKPAVSDASKRVYELVGQRVADTQRPMPPKANGKIAAQDQKAIVDWASQGGPARAANAAECMP